ncbi:MAG: diphthine--ammonia ligase [Candidatus Omnitrophica bacterium]|nr:diphthine--ammonia ligase [Candidatus Omnitrophota bacterium]MDD5237598.1 diphthine--ammonia ligase [Candidatus Omnitrophota bacterium]
MDDLTAISSWSGGKDSCLAYYKAIKQGVKVKCLLNFISRESKRGCFHGLDGQLLNFQAGLIGIPLVQEEVSPDMQKYENEFKVAVRKFITRGINSMVFGDIYLLEHQSWVERVCGELNIRAIEPLWNKSPRTIIKEFLDSGFKAMIVSCKADVMGEEFIGRYIDMDLVTDLEAKGICPCGEKGEFHTLVVDGPIFKKRIEIQEAQTIIKEGFWKHWFLDIRKYQATEKN